MDNVEMVRMWQQVSFGLNGIQNTLAPDVLNKLNALGLQMSSAISSSNVQAFRGSFQQLWSIALTQVRNVGFLNAIKPFLRPALGLVGGTWARIELCSLAVTGALASEILLSAALVIVVAAIAILLFLLIWKWLLPALSNALNWMPAQSPQPMQTPQWNRIFGALNDPTIGPTYAINTGALPSSISLG